MIDLQRTFLDFLVINRSITHCLRVIFLSWKMNFINFFDGAERFLKFQPFCDEGLQSNARCKIKITILLLHS